MSCCPICSCASHFVQSFFDDDSICVPSVNEHPHTYGMTPCRRSDVNNISIAFFTQILIERTEQQEIKSFQIFGRKIL